MQEWSVDPMDVQIPWLVDQQDDVRFIAQNIQYLILYDVWPWTLALGTGKTLTSQVQTCFKGVTPNVSLFVIISNLEFINSDATRWHPDNQKSWTNWTSLMITCTSSLHRTVPLFLVLSCSGIWTVYRQREHDLTLNNTPCYCLNVLSVLCLFIIKNPFSLCAIQSLVFFGMFQLLIGRGVDIE